jgi:heme exporter protein C
MVLIWILPRMTDSLHPGNGGNPAFSKMDLDNRMRLVFYPAIIGWTLLGFRITQIRIRIKKLEQQNELS